MGKEKSPKGLLLIGLFKLFKGILLVATGVGALKLLHKDVASVADHWIQVLRVDPDNRYIHRLLERILRVTPKQLRELSIGTFLYSSVFLTEGIGLLMRKHWAEYLTVISTAALIPLEVYETVHKFTWIKVLVLAINAAIVWYLVMNLKRKR
jgi:uncharacterized membrane protein (DUF2068 family)